MTRPRTFTSVAEPVSTKKRNGRPALPSVRYSHTITMDPDLRRSVQNYYDAAGKPHGLTVPDVLRELIMRGLQQDPVDAALSGVRFKAHRTAEELLVRRALDYIRDLDKELALHLRQAAEAGLLVAEPPDMKDPTDES